MLRSGSELPARPTVRGYLRRSTRPVTTYVERGNTMTDQTSESPILDLLAGMNLAGIEASSLDAQSLMLVRMAALVAMDAAPISYVLNMQMAGDVDVDADQIEGMLAAIAPIVGSARVASAAGKMVRALDLEINLAELEQASQA